MVLPFRRLAFLAVLAAAGCDAFTDPAPPPVAVVTLEADSLILSLAAPQLPLAVRTLDAAGRVLPDRPVEWATTDTSVATVSAQGVVTARAPGEAVVIARSGELADSVRLRVTGVAGGRIAFFAVSPDSVDVTHAAGVVTFAVRLRPGLTFREGLVNFFGPNSSVRVCNLGASAGGDGTSASCAVEVPKWAFGDSVRVQYVSLVTSEAGAAGEATVVQGAAIEAAGFPARFRIVSPRGRDAVPEVTSIRVTPSPLDLSTAGDTAHLAVRLRDDWPGVVYATIWTRSPLGRLRTCVGRLAEGTALDGTFACDLPFPARMEGGEWTVWRVDAYDSIGAPTFRSSVAKLPPAVDGSFQVHSPEGDGAPPELVSIALEPGAVRSGEQIRFSMRVRDPGVGAKRVYARMSMIYPGTRIPMPVICEGALAAGTAQDGEWRCSIMAVPVTARTTFDVVGVSLTDALDSSSFLERDALVARGFGLSFTVEP